MLRMGSGEFAARPDSTDQLRVRPATRPIGNSAERPYKEKPRCGRGLRLTVRHLKSPVSPSNPIHNADDCGKDYEGSGTEIVNASPAGDLNWMMEVPSFFAP